MKKSIDFNGVADLYDYYVGTDMDIGFYMELCKGYGNILELMCGTGRVSIPLIRQGFHMTCVDYSGKMLDVFRSKLKEDEKVRIECQDICELDLDESYDLAFIPFNSIAEITDAQKRRQAVARIHAHLLPEGHFFCTLYNPAWRIFQADGQTKQLGSFAMEEGKMLTVSYQNQYSNEQKIISGSQIYEISDAQGKLIEKRRMNIAFAVISEEEMLQTADEAGFKIRAVYGGYEKQLFEQDSRFMNFLFQKN